VVELERTLRRRDLAGSWQRSSPALKLASVVAQFAEILKGSYWAKEESLEELLRHTREVEREWRGDPEVRELVVLIERAARGGGLPEVEPTDDGWDD
jgi:Ca-activated chloride channel family protein